MENRRQTRINYDRLSRWYDMLSAASERDAKLRGIRMLDIKHDEKVLEIGCGTGEILPLIASNAGPRGFAYGLDLSAGMLNAARRKSALNGIALLQGDATRLPFPNETFDTLFMSFTLELFPAREIPSLLEECLRVIRRSGKIGIVSLLQSERPNWMERLYGWAHERWSNVVDCYPIPMMDIIRNSGFEMTDFQKISMWGLKVGILTAVKP